MIFLLYNVLLDIVLFIRRLDMLDQRVGICSKEVSLLHVPGLYHNVGKPDCVR